MSTINRTDIHRPSAIIPADYQQVGYLPHGELDGAFRVAQMEIIQAHMATTHGTWSSHEHGGNCDVCGNVQAMTHVVFYHKPTNSYIRVGETCAEKVEMNFDRKAFTHFVKCAKDARERAAGKAKAQLTLADAGLTAAWDVAQQISAQREARTLDYHSLAFPERTIDDMVGKLVRYGSLSEKQLAFMHKLVAQIADRPQVEAKRAAEAAALTACPSGRVTITGKVLTTKQQDSHFGSVTKMLVLDERNFKVWGTMPLSIFANKGDRITLTATVTPKADEHGFGFYSRPTKAKVIDDAGNEIVEPDVHDDAPEPAPLASAGRIETFRYTDSQGRSRTRTGIHEANGTYHDVD